MLGKLRKIYYQIVKTGNSICIATRCQKHLRHRGDHPSLAESRNYPPLTQVVLTNYSYLNATSGSTFVARRAGTRIATNATTVRKTDTPTNVTGSRVLRSINTA